MITLQHHVTSLELSRKLKELGVPQESHFWWVEGLTRDGMPIGWRVMTRDEETHAWGIGVPTNRSCSAFLASELGEMLPEGFTSKKEWAILNVYHVQSYEKCQVALETNEADARAKLLIHLIEQEIVDPKELAA